MALLALVASATIAAGCGADLSSPTVGDDALPTTIRVATTTTMPPTTITTIDFNRPVDQLDTPLPDDATVDDVIALLDDLRGQTDDASEQMRRLTDFAAFTTPVPAQILDVSVSIQPQDGGGYESASTLVFRVPDDATRTIRSIENDLRARVWNKASDTVDGSTEVTVTRLVFRVPGTPGTETELTVSVSDFPGATTVEFAYRTRGGDPDDVEDQVDRLLAWQSELPTPPSATLVEAGLQTTDLIGTLTAVYRLSAETMAEARDDVVDRLEGSDFRLAGQNDGGSGSSSLSATDPDGRPLNLEFVPGREEEVVELTVSTSFGLLPID